MTKDENQLRDYTVWSNFIYFIAALYSFFIIAKLRGNDNNGIYEKFIFSIFGILLIVTGIISIVYHLNTPSYKQDLNAVNTTEFKNSLKADQICASITGSFAIFILLIQIIRFHFFSSKKNINKHNYILTDSNFYLFILFAILSIIFYFIAGGHHSHAIDCGNDDNCFSENIDAYDIFHSNWHIFTSLTAIFWISIIYNSFDWGKKTSYLKN